MRIILATCEDYPKPKSDRPLRHALKSRGHQVDSIPWNRPDVSWHTSDLVVLRACWDYYAAPDEFLNWLTNIEQQGAVVSNPIDLVRWNFDKRYLVELQNLGISVVPTRIIDAKDSQNTRHLMETLGWHKAVRKPINGQSGNYIDLLDLQAAHWPAPQFDGSALLQPLQEDISRLGESLLVFFNGVYSHAFKRELPDNEWRSNAQFGSRRVSFTPSSTVIEQAQQIITQVTHLRGLTEPPCYARVDGLIRDEQLTLMELELIEPALGFELAPETAERFADAIDQLLRG